MAIEVLKVELKSVSDASGLEKGITGGLYNADEVIGVIGKTEGNGGVNDFTRILADQAFRRVLLKHGKRDEKAVNQIPMVWSGAATASSPRTPRSSRATTRPARPPKRGW